MPGTIHKTAVIADGAKLDDTVTIGPYAVIEDDVEIGAGTSIGPHAVIRRYTRIGQENSIDAHAVIGGLAQHTAFDGSETWVEIGDRNVIREGVTINRPFEAGATTRIGNDCFFMIYSHVGHDCIVGDNVVLTNNTLLGGHVEVGQNVIFGGNSGAHQFVRVGPYCMIAGQVALRKDALPFTMLGGEPVRHFRLNTIGLRRNGVSGDRYRALESAFRAIRDGNKALDGVPDTEDVRFLKDWLAAKSKFGLHGFAAPRKRKAVDDA